MGLSAGKDTVSDTISLHQIKCAHPVISQSVLELARESQKEWVGFVTLAGH